MNTPTRTLHVEEHFEHGQHFHAYYHQCGQKRYIETCGRQRSFASVEEIEIYAKKNNFTMAEAPSPC